MHTHTRAHARLADQRSAGKNCNLVCSTETSSPAEQQTKQLTHTTNTPGNTHSNALSTSYFSCVRLCVGVSFIRVKNQVSDTLRPRMDGLRVRPHGSLQRCRLHLVPVLYISPPLCSYFENALAGSQAEASAFIRRTLF